MKTITRMIVGVIALTMAFPPVAGAGKSVNISGTVTAGRVAADGGRIYLSSVNINNSAVTGNISVTGHTTIDTIKVENAGRAYISTVDLNHTRLSSLEYKSTVQVGGQTHVSEGRLLNLASGSLNGVAVSGDVALDLSATVADDIEISGEGTVILGGIRIGDDSDINNQAHVHHGASHPPVSLPEEIPPALTTLDYAHLSRCAYVDKPCNLPEGWEQVNPSDLAGFNIFVSQTIFDDAESGLHAAIFHNGLSGEWVLGFEGTGDWNDWGTNISEALVPLLIDQQYLLAGILSKSLNEQIEKKGESLTFTGHSLGGGLASMASMTTGKSAVTFNAAGLRKATALNGQYTGISKHEIIKNWKNRNNLIDAYYVKGDQLHDIQQWIIPSLGNAIGRHRPLENPGPFDLKLAHGIDVVIESLVASNKNGMAW
ncbi:MAG: hypothetical protein DSY90_06460 [Deltaproteobacteria bacterium]|nr:MAG: hypothetical protein DSY90_06460 [Deltaproteobacteria bacterium]